MTKQTYIYNNVYEAAMYEEMDKWLAEVNVTSETKEVEPVMNVYYSNEEEKAQYMQDLANCPF